MSKSPLRWKENDADSGNRMLFKLYKTSSLDEAFSQLNSVSKIILDSGQSEHISLTLSNDFLTITLNDLGQKNELSEFYEIASSLDSILSPA